jgi:hypothetical protein
VPSWHKGAPSLCGVAPSLSSCGMLPPFPKHPVTQTASRIVIRNFMGMPFARARGCTKRMRVCGSSV